MWNMTKRTRVIWLAREADVGIFAIREAAEIINHGGLVAFPTETVYGLGADATNSDAVRRIFEAKGRPATNPVIVHVADLAMARSCIEGEWPKNAERLASRFWPGPLTLVLPRSKRVPGIVSAGRETVGIRVPDHRVARALIAAAGVPIAAPSANRSTGISPTKAEHVLKDLDGRIDLLLDAGPTMVGIESTVLDLSGEHPRILRPGMIGVDELEAVLNAPVAFKDVGKGHAEGEGFGSPGQMALHYAPRTATECRAIERVSEEPGEEPVGLVVLGHPGLIVTWSAAEKVDLTSPEEAAEGLYAALHRLDEMGLRRIIVIEPPGSPEWTAIADRVRRASR